MIGRISLIISVLSNQNAFDIQRMQQFLRMYLNFSIFHWVPVSTTIDAVISQPTITVDHSVKIHVDQHEFWPGILTMWSSAEKSYRNSVKHAEV